MASEALQYSNYWQSLQYDRINKAELKSQLEELQGYKAPASLNHAALVALRQRFARGLICYDRKDLSNDMLRQFIKNRGLEMPRPAIRKSLIRVLQQADDDLRFDRFERLPPELRSIVYGFYFQGFDLHLKKNPYSSSVSIHCPTQPPLALVSRMLRKEVLPEFYKRHTIGLVLEDDLWTRRISALWGKPKPCLQPFEDTLEFLDTLAKDCDGCIRSVQLGIGKPWEHRLGAKPYRHAPTLRGSLDIHWNASKGTFAIKANSMDHRLYEQQKALKVALETALHSIERVGFKGLRVKDIFTLFSAMDGVWR